MQPGIKEILSKHTHTKLFCLKQKINRQEGSRKHDDQHQHMVDITSASDLLSNAHYGPWVKPQSLDDLSKGKGMTSTELPTWPERG